MNLQLHSRLPTAIATLRIISALLFMQHGLQKIFHFPPGGHHSEPFALFSVVGVAGVLELFGGLLIALGLFTRPVALLLSGEMAVAYFSVHFALGMSKPWGFFPVVNEGDLAILFCFNFLFFAIAGPGRFSIDGLTGRKAGGEGSSVTDSLSSSMANL